jgi:hypothetical protein
MARQPWRRRMNAETAAARLYCIGEVQHALAQDDGYGAYIALLARDRDRRRAQEAEAAVGAVWHQLSWAGA